MNNDITLAAEPWWGDLSVKEAYYHSWSLGERCIVIQRLNSEWRVWNCTAEDDTANEIIVNSSLERPSQIASQTQDNSLLRLIQKQTSEGLKILPALADRAVVARPTTPLCVLSKESVTLYVSTPLWFTATVPSKEVPVIDLPFWRPSDSWFGSSTRVGEMCYAKYTDARVDLASLERRQHRAITPVQVINNADDTLTFERVSIPVRLLTLFADKQQQLWTNTVTLTRDGETTSKIEIVQTPPFEFINPEPVNHPRTPSEKSTFIRNLGSLFA